MKSIKLKCKVITPMFMAGADGKTPELRPSEFKGMMRFWWRAIRADNNIEELREEEAKIFGGTGEKEGKSKVKVKVYPQPSDQFLGGNLKNDFRLEWRFNRNTNSMEGEDAGIGYLLYSTTLPRQERAYIKPNFQFTIELSSHDEESLNNALASLWTAIYLGGFGTRARRGAGNIIVEAIDGSVNELDFVPKGNSTDEVFNWLISNLNKCFSIINNGNPKNFCTKYSNLSFSRIIISKRSFTDWKEALNDIGKIYSEFRTNHRNKIFDTAVFGLPVLHKNRGVTVKGIKGREEFSRRSSPIIFKIIKSGEYYFWYVIRLSGEFLEEGAVIKAHGTQKPDYKLIDEFWNDLKNSGKEFVLSQPKILNNIVEKIKTECNPHKIILFGSRARGDAHKNADIDIGVEGPKNPISSIDISAPLDIVDLTKANSSLKDKIKREGVTIYEKRVKKTFLDFEKAFNNLKLAVEKAVDDLDIDGTIKRFELCYELSWKIIKLYFEDLGIICKNPRDYFKQAKINNLIEDETIWIEMIETRNQLVHEYSSEFSREIFEKIENDYVEILEELYKNRKERLGNDLV